MNRNSPERHPNRAASGSAAGTSRGLHPDHGRIARAALGVLFFAVVAKLAVAAREVVIAWRFGRGHEVDAYNLALTFATWLPLALVSVMTVVVVPLIVRLDAGDPARRERFLRELAGVGLAAGLVIGAVTWVSAPWVAQFVASGLPAATRDLSRSMLQGFAPAAMMTVLIGVYATRLQAASDHRYVLAEGLPPFTLALLLLAWPSGSAMLLIVGTVAGLALQVAWLVRSSPDVRLPATWLKVRVNEPHWRGLWGGALVMGTGQLAMSLSQPIDQWFAANVGPGAIATLGYANRLVSLGLALGATAISRATLPIFSEGVSLGEGERVLRQALAWSGLMLLVGGIAATLVWLLAPWLVALVFERGAFGSSDTAAVSDVLRWGIWQVPPYFAGIVLVARLASAGRYYLIGLVAMASILVKLGATSLLVEELGLSGIMLASVLMYATSAMLCLLAVLRDEDVKRQTSD